MKKQLSFLLACTLLQVCPATFADGYSSDEEDLYEEEEAPKGTMYHLKNIGAYIVLDLVSVALLCFLSAVVHYGLRSCKIIRDGDPDFGTIIYVYMLFGLVLGLISTLISGIVGIWGSNIAKISTGGCMVVIFWPVFLFASFKPYNDAMRFIATIIPIMSMLGIVFANWAINTEKVCYFLHGSSVVEKDDDDDFSPAEEED